MIDLTYCMKTSDIVDAAREACAIKTPKHKMTDDEIRTAMRWIGARAPDTIWVDGKPAFGRIGIGLMLSITLAEFPEYYARYGLGQFN